MGEWIRSFGDALIKLNSLRIYDLFQNPSDTQQNLFGMYLRTAINFLRLNGFHDQKSQSNGGTAKIPIEFRTEAEFAAVGGFCSAIRYEKRVSRVLGNE